MTHRLAPQMRPELGIETVRTLQHRGLRVRMLVTGTGPMLGACRVRLRTCP